MTATPTSRLEGLTTSIAWKAPVRAATTAAITLSGEQTIDGVACVEGDRVLVKNQASAINNGIYNVMANAAWERTKDFNGTLDAYAGTMVHVVNGTINAQTAWYVTGNGQKIPGTDSITWQVFPANVPNEDPGQTYLVHTQFLGTPDVSKCVGGHVFDRIVSFTASWSGSVYMRCSTPPDAAMVLTVNYPSTSVASIGTVTVSTAGLFSSSTVSAFSSTAGGLLKLTSGSTATTVVDIFMTLQGTIQ